MDFEIPSYFPRSALSAPMFLDFLRRERRCKGQGWGDADSPALFVSPSSHSGIRQFPASSKNWTGSVDRSMGRKRGRKDEWRNSRCPLLSLPSLSIRPFPSFLSRNSRSDLVSSDISMKQSSTRFQYGSQLHRPTDRPRWTPTFLGWFDTDKPRFRCFKEQGCKEGRKEGRKAWMEGTNAASLLNLIVAVKSPWMIIEYKLKWQFYMNYLMWCV